MFERRIPEWLRHAPAPSVRGFASLAGLEAITRGVLISVFPVAMINVLQDPALVSSVYFLVGVLSLVIGLLVPFLNKLIPRRFLYIFGILCYIVGNFLATSGTQTAIVSALALNFFATVIIYVCLNAYVLDYIARIELGKSETLRLFYSALGWTLGPVLGVFSLALVATIPVYFFCSIRVYSVTCFFVYAIGQWQTHCQSPHSSS